MEDIPPIAPIFVIVNVPPCVSSKFSFPDLASKDNSSISLAISVISLSCAFFITGTTNPCSVSVAIPML